MHPPRRNGSHSARTGAPGLESPLPNSGSETKEGTRAGGKFEHGDPTKELGGWPRLTDSQSDTNYATFERRRTVLSELAFKYSGSDKFCTQTRALDREKSLAWQKVASLETGPVRKNGRVSGATEVYSRHMQLTPGGAAWGPF